MINSNNINLTQFQGDFSPPPVIGEVPTFQATSEQPPPNNEIFPPEVLAFNEYDNEISKLLKIAMKQYTPVKFLHIVGNRLLDSDITEENVISLLDELQKYIDENKYPLPTIVMMMNYFSPYNIMMAYASIEKANLNDEIKYVQIKNILQTYKIFSVSDDNFASDIKRLKETWDSDYLKEFQKDYEKLQKILEVQNQFREIPQIIESTEPVYTNYSLGYEFNIKSKIEEEVDDIEVDEKKAKTLSTHKIALIGEKLFNQMTVSNMVPFVRYAKNWKLEDTIKTKIYKGDNPFRAPNLKYIVWQPSKKLDNMIYLTVWVKINPSDHPYNTNKKNYIQCTYDIAKNILLTKIEDEKIDVSHVTAELEKAFGLKIQKSARTNLSANFKLVAPMDLVFDNLSLAYAISLYPFYHFYLSINEPTRMVDGIKPMKIYYRGARYDDSKDSKAPSKAVIILEQLKAVSNQNMTIVKSGGIGGIARSSSNLNLRSSTSSMSSVSSMTSLHSSTVENPEASNSSLFTLNNNQFYINVNISKALSKEVINHVISVLKAILYKYNTLDRNEILNFYSQFMDVKSAMSYKLVEGKGAVVKSKNIEFVKSMDSMVLPYIEAEYNSYQLSEKINQVYPNIPSGLNHEQLNQFLNHYYPNDFPLYLNPLDLNERVRRYFSDIFAPVITDPKIISKKLNELYPDLVIPGMTRHGSRFLIVKPEEIPYWTSLKIPGTNYNRQVLRFQLYGQTEPKFYFTAIPIFDPTHKEYNKQFPSWRHNKRLTNANIYPFIPGTYKENQIPVPGVDENGKASYYRYMTYLRTGEISSTVGSKLNIANNIEPNRTADLPKLLEHILDVYIANGNKTDVNGSSVRISEDFSGIRGPFSSPSLTSSSTNSNLSATFVTKFVRYGVIYDKNSFLHCIADIFVPEYAKSPDQTKKAIVQNMRASLLNHVHLAVFRQELYDFTDQQIREIIADPEEVFDPAYFYHALEELFDVNIYIFGHDPHTKDIFMDLPRYKYTHIRQYRTRKNTVMLYKHIGNVSTSLKYPNYNIIMNAGQRKIYGETENKNLYRFQESTLKTYSIDNALNVYDNLFNQVNLGGWINERGGIIKAQFIDSFGKNRGFILTNGLTMISIPAQPINVPEAMDYSEVTYQMAKEFMKIEPSHYDFNQRKEVIGLWYTVANVENSLYIPVKAEKIDEVGVVTCTIGNPLKLNKLNETGHYIKLIYYRNIILYFTSWLFVLSDHNFDILEPPSGVLSGAIAPLGGILTSSSNNLTIPFDYDIPPGITNMQFKTYAEVINYLIMYIPKLTKNNKIYCYSPKLFKDLHYFIKILANTTKKNDKKKNNDNEEDIINNNIALPYQYSSPNAHIFNDYISYITWANNISIENIVTKMELSYALQINPYLYLDAKNTFYIVQNVKGGSLTKAMNVANTWKNERINIGYNADDIDVEEIYYPEYVIYSITLDNNIAPTTIRATMKGFICILQYTDFYAALLPVV